jgi:hypothetical protein
MVMALRISRHARARLKYPAGKKAKDVMHDLLPSINKCILQRVTLCAIFKKKKTLVRKQK